MLLSDEGIMIALRIIYYIQQSVFLHLRKLHDRDPTAAGAAPAPPDFTTLADQLTMNMHTVALPVIPETWMEAIKSQLPEYFGEAPSAPLIRGGGPGTGDDEQGGGRPRGQRSTPVVNMRPNAALIQRWKDSGLNRIQDMLSHYQGEGDPPIPMYNDRIQACCNWFVKGKCKSDCLRGESHKPGNSALFAKFHGLMDQCQVAGSGGN